jgi:hypothetical protein
LDEKDFLIKEAIIEEDIEYENQNSYPYGQEHPHITRTYKIANYDQIPPCRLIRKNDRFQEPFIFVGKKYMEH